MTETLPDFGLEVYLGEWKFAACHHLTASEAQTAQLGGVRPPAPGLVISRSLPDTRAELRLRGQRERGMRFAVRELLGGVCGRAGHWRFGSRPRR